MNLNVKLCNNLAFFTEGLKVVQPFGAVEAHYRGKGCGNVFISAVSRHLRITAVRDPPTESLGDRPKNDQKA